MPRGSGDAASPFSLPDRLGRAFAPGFFFVFNLQ